MTRAETVLLAALSLPVSAAAAPKRKAVSAPKTSASDKLAFDQTSEFLLLEAGQAYLKDEAMPDPSILDNFLSSLKDPELGKAKESKTRLEGLIAAAERVQQGAEGLSPEEYALLVDEAADGLDAGALVEQNFVPNARAGRSLDAAEKALVKACQAEARDKAFDRRSFYKRCLGRKRAQEVYIGPDRRRAGTGMPAEASQAKVPEALGQGVSRNLEKTRASLLWGMPMGGETGAVAGAGASARGPSAPAAAAPAAPAGLKTAKPPAPATTADLSAGAKLARVAKADEIGFTGYCYSYVKAALQKVGIVDRDTVGRAGAGAHAKQFAEFVDKNPALLKRKLRRVQAPSWPLPIGTIVVWSPRACNYNAVSGHIEIVTRLKPPQACSDGCGTFQVACLEELAADPARAAQELPAARQELLQAQADLDALKDSKDRKARQAAATELRRKKASVAAVEARLDPRVAAYLIERQ